MKIRSITAFIGQPSPGVVQKAADDCLRMKDAFESDGWTVQSIRLATIPFTQWLPLFHAPWVAVQKLEEEALSAGFNYISLGSIPADESGSGNVIPEILKATEATFCTLQLVRDGYTIIQSAIHEAARIILANSGIDPDGFTNLRFAALANVPPGCPFFPAASSASEETSFAIAMEGADLAVEVFSTAGDSKQATELLSTRIETEAKRIEGLCASHLGPAFRGIDFTLSPSPEELSSIGLALERLGVSRFGQNGTVASCAFLMSIQDHCSYRKVGFNGLMLPVLEDTILADRNSDGFYDISRLLLYSTVCGTGLDCIPLPGDTEIETMEAILLDLAALSCRLQKPLTARLMPVPGKKAGELTTFNFAYFANSRIMSPGEKGLSGILKTNPELVIQPRTK